MENLIKEIQAFLAPFKEIFLFLGIIVLVWAIVALIIKIFIRKSDKSDDLENDIE